MTVLGSGCLPSFGGDGQPVGQSTGQSGGQSGGSTTGAAPCLVVSPSALDFDDVLVGDSSTKKVVLSNQCSTPVTVVDLTLGGDWSLFSVSEVPETLGPSASALASVSFTPLALETRSGATVTLEGSDRGNANLNLSGESGGLALSVSPTAIDFGEVPLATTAIGCTTVANESSAAIDLTLVDFYGAGSYAVSPVDDSTPPRAAPIPVSVPSGGSAKVCFSFTPTTVGWDDVEETLFAGDPRLGFPNVYLQGWGAGPQISCTPLSIDMSQELDPRPPPVVCTNVGSPPPGSPLIINQVELTGPGAGAWRAETVSGEYDGSRFHPLARRSSRA